MTLEDYLFENGFLVWEFADLIGYCPNYISGIKNGKRKVTKKLRYRIMQATGGKVVLEVNQNKRRPNNNVRSVLDRMKEAIEK